MCRGFFLRGGRQGGVGNAVSGTGPGRSGFTLVELLVVVAIIALLVSILLPSLNYAKEQTRMVVCLTNLRGLSTAFTYYTSENNQWYPQGGGQGGDPPTWDHILLPHYQNYDMIHCPADHLDRTPFYGSTDRYPRSYAINISASWKGPSDYDPDFWPGYVHKATEVTRPAETILLGEMWQALYYTSQGWRPGIYNWYKCCGIFWGDTAPYGIRTPTDDVHRYNDAANYLFCDGRATLLPADEPNLTDQNDYYYWKRTK